MTADIGDAALASTNGAACLENSVVIGFKIFMRDENDALKVI